MCTLKLIITLSPSIKLANIKNFKDGKEGKVKVVYSQAWTIQCHEKYCFWF